MTHAPSTFTGERLREFVARAGQCQTSGRAQESLRVQPARTAPADSPRMPKASGRGGVSAQSRPPAGFCHLIVIR